MMAKKRKLKASGVFALLALIAVVVFAVVIVVKVLNGGDDALEPQVDVPTTSVDVVTSPDVETPASDDDDLQSDDAQKEPDTPVIPTVNEDIPVISSGAPKPVYTQEELIALYPDAVLSSTEDAGDDYVDKIYFIGDSTTHGMKFYGVLRDGKETTHVWTPRSGTLAMWNLLSEKIVLPEDDSELTIPEAFELKTPNIAVLTLGVNGVSSCSKEQFTGYYKDLIDAIKEASPYTTIILQSIFPVCSDYQYVNSISMEKINNANAWIAELADEKDCYYLNTTSVLVDETGYLNPEYSNGDGIHISPKGFEVILDYIKTHSAQ